MRIQVIEKLDGFQAWLFTALGGRMCIGRGATEEEAQRAAITYAEQVTAAAHRLAAGQGE